jgi:hypothetical protein
MARRGKGTATMTRASQHNDAISEVRKLLRQFDSLAGGAIPAEQHVSAMYEHTKTLRASLSDGFGQPLERFRLARVAAHAIALMADE